MNGMFRLRARRDAGPGLWKPARARIRLIAAACVESLEQRLHLSAAQLAFIQQPTRTLPGNAINPAVSVAVEDSTGSVVVGDNSTVTMTLSTGGTFTGGG